MLRRWFALLAVALPLLTATPALAQSAPTCQFILGFKALHDLDPTDIGVCLDNQAFAANGDAIQHTTDGLLVWRKADNWTAFTDGYRTWINGPNGLQERLNTQRFSWEANPDGLPLADAGTGASSAGTITGTLSYPDSGLPDLWVYAIPAGARENGVVSAHVPSASTRQHYALSPVPPGAYYVFALPCPTATVCTIEGAYTRDVICGLTFACNDHELLAVVVQPGETTAGIDPSDFYAPRNAWCMPAWAEFTCLGG